MGDNELNEQRFGVLERDIKTLYKKYDSLESMKEILIELKIISANTGEAILDLKRGNDQRDEMVREQCKIVQDQSIALSKVCDSLNSIKNEVESTRKDLKKEIDETKDDLKNLDSKIDDKSKKPDKFESWVYGLGLKLIEWAIIGGLAYYLIKK